MATRKKTHICTQCGGQGRVALRTSVLIDGAELRKTKTEEVSLFYRCERDRSHAWWVKSRRRVDPATATGSAALAAR